MLAKQSVKKTEIKKKKPKRKETLEILSYNWVTPLGQQSNYILDTNV